MEIEGIPAGAMPVGSLYPHPDDVLVKVYHHPTFIQFMGHDNPHDNYDDLDEYIGWRLGRQTEFEWAANLAISIQE